MLSVSGGCRYVCSFYKTRVFYASMMIVIFSMLLGFYQAHRLALDTSAAVSMGLAMILLGVLVQGYACLFLRAIRTRRLNRHPVCGVDDGEFRRLCLINGHLRVTYRDSMAAGNCMFGSLEFYSHFRGGKSVSLKQFQRYCCKGARVRQVANYVLATRGNLD